MFGVMLMLTVFSGPLPPPDANRHLYLAVHTGSWQCKRLISDVQRDLWLHAHFHVHFVEDSDILDEPLWRTSRFGKWTRWPKGENYKTCFATSGFATRVLRSQLWLDQQRHRQIAFQWVWDWRAGRSHAVAKGFLKGENDFEYNEVFPSGELK